MKEKILLFDLDGTLTDSKEGILRCASVALAAFGIEAEPSSLMGFIGPPLAWSFPHFFHLNEEQTEEAIRIYRKHYAAGGKFENRVYDGVREMLTSLAGMGYRLAVATSKPEGFSCEILSHFDLARYFECISGADPTQAGDKESVIRAALSRLGVTDPTDALMIGDRLHDMIGAERVGMRSVGVLWGYGSREELLEAGASAVCETPRDLVTLLAR